MIDKLYYLNRDGATPQIIPANDDLKLKVYDTFNDIDTTQLSDGEIVSTKEDAGHGNIYDYIDALLPVGMIAPFYGTNSSTNNWLLCDGRDTTGTSEELANVYPKLYAYLGDSNVLPDLRECVLVGAGTNGTDTIAAHDTYTVGQFKDDQLQSHTHTFPQYDGNLSPGSAGAGGGARTTWTTYGASGRTGTTTHGKQKGVNYYIKAN